jgi:uncharacterized protein (TIGR03435 family)
MSTRKLAGWALAVWVSAATAFAAGPKFEVASIRPSPELTPELVRSGKVRAGMSIEHGRVDIAGIPLRAVIQTAFRTQQPQITGPDWLTSTRFDIQATIPAGVSEDQVPEMLQALLADRFKLVVHRETKDQPAFALVVAKGGIKAKEVPPDTEVPAFAPDPAAGPGSSQVAPLGGKMIRVDRTANGGAVLSSPETGTMRLVPDGRGYHLEAPKVTFAGFATLLTELAGRPVIDMTETKGYYQIVLDVSFQEMIAQIQELQAALGAGQPGAAAAPEMPTNLMANAVIAAVQRLGLKLETRKAPMEMIVVDHMEKSPTEN